MTLPVPSSVVKQPIFSYIAALPLTTGGTPFAIENGKAQGNLITFEVNPDERYQFKLELKGEQLKGTVVTRDGLSIEIDLKRP